MTTFIGYARVSRTEQDTQLQRDALRKAGVRKVFEEKRAGAGVHRPELERMLDQLRAGDVVVVFKLDRLARSLQDLLRIIASIEGAGASFCSLTEHIDTSTSAGRMMMQMVGAFAEFERSMIRERSMAGQRAAMERGAVCGRPRALSPAKEKQVVQRWISGKYTLSELASMNNVSVSSIKRTLARPGLISITERSGNGVRLDLVERAT